MGTTLPHYPNPFYSPHCPSSIRLGICHQGSSATIQQLGAARRSRVPRHIHGCHPTGKYRVQGTGSIVGAIGPPYLPPSLPPYPSSATALLDNLDWPSLFNAGALLAILAAIALLPTLREPPEIAAAGATGAGATGAGAIMGTAPPVVHRAPAGVGSTAAHSKLKAD